MRRDFGLLQYHFLALLFLPEAEKALSTLPIIQHEDAKLLFQQKMLMFLQTSHFSRMELSKPLLLKDGEKARIKEAFRTCFPKVDGIDTLADLLTEPEIMAAILTDTPQLARHPALKTIDNILRVFVNKYYGGGEDKLRFSQLDLMEFFKAVLECDPKDENNE